MAKFRWKQSPPFLIMRLFEQKRSFQLRNNLCTFFCFRLVKKNKSQKVISFHVYTSNMTVSKRIILKMFLFMAFVQSQKITLPKNVEYISTDLIAHCCYTGVPATLYCGQLVWICACLFLETPFIVHHHGDILTVVIVCLVWLCSIVVW